MTQILNDTPCIVCDYNLRGLEREGVCPECGARIEQSFQGDLLRFADQRWVSRVHRGMRITRISARALYASIIAAVCGLVPLLLFEHLQWERVVGVVGTLVFLPCAFVMVAWPVGTMAGLWMISTREPRGGTGGALRAFVFRWLSVLVMPCIAAWFLVLIPRERFGQLEPTVFIALQCVSIAVIGFHAALLVDHVRALGRRSATFDEKRAAFLQRVRGQVIGFSIVFAVICVPGEVMKPMGTPVTILVFTIIWLAAHSSIEKVVECIGQERAAASAAH